MAIEFPSRPIVLDEPGVLDERLASLEDPSFAERLIRENPALFAQEPPRTQREILAWTTRRWGPALLAVTAAVSIAAGYFGSGISRGHATVQPAAQHAVVVPVRHALPVARHHVVSAPAHVAHQAVVTPNAHAVQHHALAPVAVYHTVVSPATHPLPVREALPARPNPRVHERARSQPLPLPQAGGPQTAAAQLAAWEAMHRTHRQANAAAAVEPAPRTQPRSEPAAATETANATASRTEPVTTTVPGGTPDPGQGGGVKTPPTNPGGVWTERIPGGGTLGGGMGPVIGVPRDSCTPRGGRTGIVMEAISVLMSSRH
jgi:hypothetical protein